MVIEATSNRMVSRLIMLAVLALIAGLYVRQAAETRRVREENEELRRRVEASLPALSGAPDAAAVDTAAASAEPAQPAASEPTSMPAMSAAMDPNLVLTPTGLAAPPRDDGLSLAATEAVEVTGGIRATMTFHPTTTEPIGIVALVVRLPVDGLARILDLNPAGSLRFAEVAKRVAEDGKFAVYQMQADAVEELAFDITVSEPVVAEVRGTSGIGAFDVNIQPGNVTVTRK